MFNLVLICNEEKIFDGNVSAVKIETENGPVTILPKHQAYMSKISKNLIYTPSGEDHKSIDISDGFVYTNGSVCFAVVDK